jgi:hypothetical protein
MRTDTPIASASRFFVYSRRLRAVVNLDGVRTAAGTVLDPFRLGGANFMPAGLPSQWRVGGGYKAPALARQVLVGRPLRLVMPADAGRRPWQAGLPEGGLGRVLDTMLPFLYMPRRLGGPVSLCAADVAIPWAQERRDPHRRVLRLLGFSTPAGSGEGGFVPAVGWSGDAPGVRRGLYGGRRHGPASPVIRRRKRHILLQVRGDCSRSSK